MNFLKYVYCNFIGLFGAQNPPGEAVAVSQTVTEANNLPFQFWYKWKDGLNMTINLINFPKNVTELTYTWRSGIVSDMPQNIDLAKPNIHIETRVMHFNASVFIDLRTSLSVKSCFVLIASGTDVTITADSGMMMRSGSKLLAETGQCSSPKWCLITVDLSKICGSHEARNPSENTTRNTTTRAVSSPTTTQSPTTEDPPNRIRNTTTLAASSPTTTQTPTTEDPANNFNAATPEAVFLTNEVFLHYVLPALICVVLVGVIAIMCLCIRRQRRLCSEDAGINDNNTGNEVLYADLELNATNNYQVRLLPKRNHTAW
ncbi:hypothetical protein HW555_011682 [Spodoptera exigua]|uniref:Uncharacterized protein n=1 Tax=Spodoptera exigua TaxID=7107 RepID=A0A835KZR5_SPOEX|nr:hypothetical protein HW555_011682 [Spodoptera exigua]